MTNICKKESKIFNRLNERKDLYFANNLFDLKNT